LIDRVSEQLYLLTHADVIIGLIDAALLADATTPRSLQRYLKRH
jgi:hypothetical protein